MEPRSKTAHLVLKLISIVTVVLIGIFAYVSLFTSSESIVDKLTVEWPQPKATLTEIQTFRVAVTSDYKLSDVRVIWSVEDNRQTGELAFDGSVFVADVNTAIWDWKRDSQYAIQFTALNRNGDVLATSSVVVTVGQAIATIAEQPDSSATTSTERTEADFIDTFVVPNTQMGAVVTAPAVSNLAPAQKFRVEWVPGPERGNQQFIFHTEGYVGRDISAFWSAEGGHKNLVFKDANAKVFTAALNVGGWLWKGVGPYPITFSITDKNTSAEIASEVLDLYWKGKPGESGIEFRSRGVNIKVPAATPPVVLAATPSTSTIKTPPATPTSVIPTVKPNSTPPATTVVDAPLTKVLAATTILGKTNLYIPTKPAVVNTLTKLTDATQKNAHTYILNQPSAVWLNGDSYETDAYIQGIIASAVAKNTVPSFVLYNIVQRDCNSYSSGGAKTMADYKAWINRLSNVFKNSAAIIVVEPDALSMLNCVSGTQKTERLEMIRYAVTTLTQASPKLLVYIDAGHPFWVNAEEMATRLKSAGVGSARGFAINVSSYASTQDNVTFGTYLSNLLGGKQYVIDTSRNGNGRASNGEWCNPSGRALGQSGTIYPGNKGALDALLWIKFPGESDGTCNGGPGAGTWWAEYATALYTNRK